MADDNLNKVDVNKPVENPELKAAMQQFIQERTEKNALALGYQLNHATFLIAMVTDEMITKESNDGSSVIEKGSKIKILNCFNDKGECYLPLFTDWEEIQLWTTQNVGGLISQSKETWEFVLAQPASYKGVVINPQTVGWTLHHQELKNLMEDLR